MRRTPALALLLLVAPLALAAAKPNKRLSDEEQGKLLYERHCLACHGATNAGDGPATDALVVPVPDLRGQLSRETREDHATVVLQGRAAMPGYQVTFDRYDARRVLRYMEKLPTEVVEEPPAEEEPEDPAVEEEEAPEEEEDVTP